MPTERSSKSGWHQMPCSSLIIGMTNLIGVQVCQMVIVKSDNTWVAAKERTPIPNLVGTKQECRRENGPLSPRKGRGRVLRAALVPGQVSPQFAVELRR